VERRDEQKTATRKGNKMTASTVESLLTKLNRIAETAKQHSAFQFKTLAHLVNPQSLLEAFKKISKDAASGIDGVTAKEYEKELAANVADLHERLKQKRYRAQPMRRVYIEKEDGKQRPLSIPCLEDKIVQRAVSEILNRIYENDFLPCSYGYRPGRSAHDAVRAIEREIMCGKVNYVLDADLENFFGSIDKKQLMEMLERRIQDKNLLRVIGKWLHVGVMEGGEIIHSENGVHQGSVISPILANLYLHVVLDEWIETTVRSRMKGDMNLFRFCDDFILCFQYQEDAEKVLRVLPQRFKRFGLALHPDKTKLIEFGRYAEERRGGRKAPTFKFLGFIFIGAKSRQGRFTLKLRTIPKRMGQKLNEIRQWCRKYRHAPLKIQQGHLSKVLLGHYNYYGWPSNYGSLAKFSRGVKSAWMFWLGRRGQKGYYGRKKFNKTLERYPLPPPRLNKNGRAMQLTFPVR
jgi:RNA-directed DNA polymerase